MGSMLMSDVAINSRSALFSLQLGGQSTLWRLRSFAVEFSHWRFRLRESIHDAGGLIELLRGMLLIL